MTRTIVSILVSCGIALVPAASARAQGPSIARFQSATSSPSDTEPRRAERRTVVEPWLALNVGRGTGTRICPGCDSRAAKLSPERATGRAGSLTAGVTLTRSLGIGATLAGWSYCESYDCIRGRASVFYLATVQYVPAQLHGIALRGSVGEVQTSESGFGGGKAPGPAVGVGAIARLPRQSPLSLTVSLDYLESLAGKYRAVPRYNPGVGSYRTRVVMIGVGVEAWFAHSAQ